VVHDGHRSARTRHRPRLRASRAEGARPRIRAPEGPRAARVHVRRRGSARAAGRVRQRIVDRPPEQHSAIGKVVVGSDGRPVINATAVIGANREQLKIETQYRAMFGVDLATRPGPVLDERQIIMMAEVRAVQQYRAQQAPLPALPALPSGYQSMSPDEQMRASMDRLRAAKQAQDAAIAQRQAEDEIVDAELVDD
jgi:hypothetical protein